MFITEKNQWLQESSVPSGLSSSFLLKALTKATAAFSPVAPLRSLQRASALALRRIFCLSFLSVAGAMSITLPLQEKPRKFQPVCGLKRSSLEGFTLRPFAARKLFISSAKASRSASSLPKTIISSE